MRSRIDPHYLVPTHRRPNNYTSTAHVDGRTLGAKIAEFLATHPSVSRRQLAVQATLNESGVGRIVRGETIECTPRVANALLAAMKALANG